MESIYNKSVYNSGALKEIRAEAKKHGLTFKRMTSIGTINGAPAYKFVERGNGDTVISNCTLGSAYTIVCSGELPDRTAAAA